MIIKNYSKFENDKALMGKFMWLLIIIFLIFLWAGTMIIGDIMIMGIIVYRTDPKYIIDLILPTVLFCLCLYAFNVIFSLVGNDKGERVENKDKLIDESPESQFTKGTIFHHCTDFGKIIKEENENNIKTIYNNTGVPMWACRRAYFVNNKDVEASIRWVLKMFNLKYYVSYKKERKR